MALNPYTGVTGPTPFGFGSPAQAEYTAANAQAIIQNLGAYQSALAYGLSPGGSPIYGPQNLAQWQQALVGYLTPGSPGSSTPLADAVQFIVDRATYYREPIPGSVMPTWYDPGGVRLPPLGQGAPYSITIPAAPVTTQFYPALPRSRGRLNTRGVPLQSVTAGYAYGGLNSPPLRGSREDPLGIRRPQWSREPFAWKRRMRA